MVAVFLAEGFEISEAMTPLDYMRRADIDARTVSVSGARVKSSCGVEVAADLEISSLDLSELDAVVLPGGMPGAENLAANEQLLCAVDYAVQNRLLVAAICASPAVVLARRGLLGGKRAVCYPSYAAELSESALGSGLTEYDPPFLTGKAAGAAAEFGLRLVELIKGREAADQVKQGVCL